MTTTPITEDPVSQRRRQAQALSRRLARLPEDQRLALMRRLQEQGIDAWTLPVPRWDAPPQDGEAPLSFAQERLRLLQALEPESPKLNLFGAFRLTGTLNLEALDHALAQLIERHAILRSEIVADTRDNAANPGFVQRVRPASAVDSPPLRSTMIDVSRAHGRGDTKLHEMIRASASRPFDLARAPLFRIELLRVREHHYVIVVTMHHIVADAWSFRTLVEEIGAGYQRALRTPAPATDMPPPVQYADFARWQRNWLGGDALDAQRRYWRQQLGSASALPRLSTRGESETVPAETGLPGRVLTCELPSTLSAALRELGRRRGMTPYMLMLAAFQLWLHRFSDCPEVRVGSSIANRPRPELEGSIGFFVNLLVLRADFADNPTLDALLERTRTSVLGAIQNQDLPFEQVVALMREGLGLDADAAFQALFVFQNAPSGTLSLPDLRIEHVVLPERFARYGLSLRVSDHGSTYRIAVEFDRRKWDEVVAAQLLVQYRHVLDAMVSDPGSRVSEVAWCEHNTLAQFEHIAERSKRVAHQVTSESCVDSASQGSRRPTGYSAHEQGKREPRDVEEHGTHRGPGEQCGPGACTLNEAVAAQARHHPSRLAVITPTARMTYSQLAAGAQHLASELVARGVRPGDRVAVVAEPSTAAVVTFVAILEAGGAYVPLDTEWPPARRREVARCAGARFVVSSDPACDDPDPDALRIEALSLEGHPPRRHPGWAYVIATSGSTGRPKAVAVGHGAVLRYVEGLFSRVDLPQDATMLWLTGAAADLGYTSLWGALASGRTLMTCSRATALDPQPLSRFLQPDGADFLKIAPSHLSALLHATDDGRSLLPRRVLVLGGEAPPPRLLQQVRREHPTLAIFNHYGPTEATIGVTMEAVASPLPTVIPIGTPLPHVRAYVLDRYGAPMPEGAVGELALGGPCLAHGYLDAPSATAAAFAPDPRAGCRDVEPGARVYRTGDRARVRAGRLELLGRRDAQLNLRGFRLEPGEIEARLQALPGISAARVLAAPSESLEVDGPSSRLLALVVGDETEPPDADALRKALAVQLPRYMVPASVIVLDRLPLLKSGKVDQQVLAAMATEATRPVGTGGEGRHRVEQCLMEVWRSVLKTDAIGIHDNFFALGGDSILALQIVARARRQGFSLTPKQLFGAPSVAALSQTLAATAPAAQRESHASDAIPLSLTPIQHWFFEQQLQHPGHYNQALMLTLPQALDEGRLRSALRALQQRHAMLRGRFRDAEGGVRPELGEAYDMLERVAVDSPSEIPALAAERQAALSLPQGRLARAVYFDLSMSNDGPTPDRLLLFAHHLIVDGVSWRILLDDLQLLLRDEDPGPPSASYAAWGAQLGELAVSTEILGELPYWRSLPEGRPLPRDREGDNVHASVAQVAFELSEEQTTGLLQWTAQRGLRVDAVLLSALIRTVAAWSGNAGLVLECEAHGRSGVDDNLDLSRTVGWFTSRFPLYLELGDEDATGSIEEVQYALESVPRGGIGYGVLRYLSPEGAALRSQRSPEVAFNYLGQLDRGVETEGLHGNTADAPAMTAGAQRDPQGKRGPLLAINARVARSRLHVAWLYSRNLHTQATIEHLVSRMRADLLRAVGETC